MIDDELHFVKEYIEAIQLSDMEVKYFSDIDSAWFFFDKCKEEELDVIIIDIMMTAGERYKKLDTNDGLSTGEYFYRELREKFKKPHIIILTNKNRNDNQNKFDGINTHFTTKEETDSIKMIDLLFELKDNSDARQ